MNRNFCALATLGLLVCVPAAVRAQGGASPYDGLFQPRQSENNPALHQKLDVNFSLVGAYDDDVVGLPGSVPGASDAQSSGLNTTFVGSGSYAYERRKVQFGANATTAARYYSDIDDYTYTHSAGVGVSAQLAQRSKVSVNQTLAYSPPYLYGLFPSVQAQSPGSIDVGGPDYIVNDTESYQYDTSAMLSQGITRRGTVSLSASHQHTDFVQESATRRDVSYNELGAGFQNNLTRNTAFTAGYRYRTGDLGFGGGGSTTEQGATIGVDYTKRMSTSRRAIFRANVGSSVVEVPESIPFGVEGGRHTGITGEVGVDYQFGRSWQARGSYRRGVQYVAQVTTPILADGVTAIVNGLLAPRLDFSVVGGYSSGESALSFASLVVDTYTADIRLRFAHTHSISSFVEYLYYFYDFSGNTQLAPGVLGRVERNGLRAGVTIWFSARRR